MVNTFWNARDEFWTALVSEGMKTGRAKTDFIECVGDEGQPKFLFAGNRWSYKINLNKHTQIILDLFAASRLLPSQHCGSLVVQAAREPTNQLVISACMCRCFSMLDAMPSQI